VKLSVLVLAAGLVTTPAWSDPTDSIVIIEPPVEPAEPEETEREEAQRELYPRFFLVHDLEFTPSSRLAGYLQRDLEALQRLSEEVPDLQVSIINLPDADAGCLPGHRLYLSRGLVSRMEHFEELRAGLALALTACPQASRTWQERENQGLPELELTNRLAHRYRDYRLEDQSTLYRQLTARGCAPASDCVGLAWQWLEDLGTRPQALGALLYRVERHWPDAALFQRFSTGHEPVTGPDRSERFVESLDAIKAEQEAMDHLRRVNRDWLEGDLMSASRSLRRARNTTHNPWLVSLATMRVSLANLQPEAVIRELDLTVSHLPGFPLETYFRGMALMQMGRPAESIDLLEHSLQILPRVSAHFTLGMAYENLDQSDQATAHYRFARTGGDIHPQGRGARVRLEGGL